MRHKEVPALEHSFYSEIYQCLAPKLFAYAYQQTTSREDAEDIVVEVFLSILENERFQSFDREKQEAWLWAITRNKIVDHHRRSVKRPQISIEWLSEPLYEDEMGSPESVSLKHEEYAQLYRVMKSLPEQQQEVLRLRFGHGLKCEEIASVLEKNTGSVCTMLSRTLQRLRGLYDNQRRGGK